MDTNLLKQKILDLAIRGKLVPQDHNDKPAIDLLKRINPDFTPCDDSQYEDLPSSWCVVKIGDVYSHTTGKALKKSNQEGVLRKYITTSNLYWNSFDFTEVRSMYFTDRELDKCTAKKGDLLVCNGGDVGRAAIWNRDEDICIQNHISRLRPLYDSIVDNLFYCYIFMYLKQKGNLAGKGVAITSLSASDMLSIPIPLPPINEQNRIVSEVQKWFAIIDEIKLNKQDLGEAVNQTKSKILDLAIHGKLVPQDPNDEPASVLLKRIHAEKERLIRDGKMKHSKGATSETSLHNNVTYEIPGNWEWVTLGELCSFLSRGKSPKYSEERKYPVFAQKCNLYNGDISLEKARFLDPNTLSNWSEEYKLRDGDVLINSTGTGTVGRTRLFHSDILGDYPFVVPDSHVSVVRTFDEIDSKFVFAFLFSNHGKTFIESNLAGSTNQKELHIGVLENMKFPLPPHNEQVRIAAKIEEIFAVLDKIKESLE